MTHGRFDARASSPRAPHYARPAYARGGAIAFRIVRLVWLTARFARRDLVSIDEYRHRFGTSLRSFHRDLTILREAGFEITPILPRTYRTVCFTSDSDGASPHVRENGPTGHSIADVRAGERARWRTGDNLAPRALRPM